MNTFGYISFIRHLIILECFRIVPREQNFALCSESLYSSTYHYCTRFFQVNIISVCVRIFRLSLFVVNTPDLVKKASFIHVIEKS